MPRKLVPRRVTVNPLYVRCAHCQSLVKLKRDRLNGWSFFNGKDGHFLDCKAKREKKFELKSQGPLAAAFSRQLPQRDRPEKKTETKIGGEDTSAVHCERERKADIKRNSFLSKSRGHLSWSQWDLHSSSPFQRNGHLACVGITTQLCVAVEVTGGLCERSVKQLCERGVALWDNALEGEADRCVRVEDILRYAQLPVSNAIDGPMLSRERYSAQGLEVGNQASLSQALTHHSDVGYSAFEMTDQRQRTQTIVVMKDRDTSFFWFDSHPCKANGEVAEKSEGKAMWLHFRDACQMDDWLENHRYCTTPARVIQFSLHRVTVPDKTKSIAENIPLGCGRCGICFTLSTRIQPREQVSRCFLV